MIYAKQCNPEYQESPIYYDQCFPDNIAVCGNRDYKERLPEVFERVLKVLDEEEGDDAIYDITHRRSDGYWCSFYKNVTEAINDLLPSEKGKYNTHDIHDLKIYIQQYPVCRSFEKENILCKVLTIVTGREWNHKTIRGSAQGDWNEIYYPVDEWDEKSLDEFETMYFNEGSEWIIHDGDNIPEEPEDIEGYSMYCCSWDEAGIRREIANECGVPESEVVMYKYAGETRVPIYELAS